MPHVTTAFKNLVALVAQAPSTLWYQVPLGALVLLPEGPGIVTYNERLGRHGEWGGIIAKYPLRAKELEDEKDDMVIFGGAKHRANKAAEPGEVAYNAFETTLSYLAPGTFDLGEVLTAHLAEVEALLAEDAAAVKAAKKAAEAKKVAAPKSTKAPASKAPKSTKKSAKFTPALYD